MNNKHKSLTPTVKHIIQDKGTERPNTGKYNLADISGTYLCRQCGLALFRSTDKFLSSCGWPSFDDEIKNAIKRLPDSDGRRTEILCNRCDAHLGHVFIGEHYTNKNLRHCVNSLSLDFVHDLNVTDTEEIILAGGCFWGVEYYLKQQNGVLLVESGYIGGSEPQPNYKLVCSGRSGYLEAVRVIFNPNISSTEDILKLFFEIHDPTQVNGQGPDIGEQYKSAIFYYNDTQKILAENLITQLKKNNYDIVTKLIPATIFWLAEEYHQNYYFKNNKQPYCHRKVSRF